MAASKYYSQQFFAIYQFQPIFLRNLLNIFAPQVICHLMGSGWAWNCVHSQNRSCLALRKDSSTYGLGLYQAHRYHRALDHLFLRSTLKAYFKLIQELQASVASIQPKGEGKVSQNEGNNYVIPQTYKKEDMRIQFILQGLVQFYADALLMSSPMACDYHPVLYLVNPRP